MKQEQVLAGLRTILAKKQRYTTWTVSTPHLVALVNKFVQDEREECAKLAETTVCDIHLPTGTKIYGSRVAAAIRARGNA